MDPQASGSKVWDERGPPHCCTHPGLSQGLACAGLANNLTGSPSFIPQEAEVSLPAEGEKMREAPASKSDVLGLMACAWTPSRWESRGRSACTA